MDELQIEILEEIIGGYTFQNMYTDSKGFQGDRIRVLINSIGGDVFESTLIYNYLKGYKAEVEIVIPALAASGATIISCAGNVVRMPKNGYYMLHEARGGVHGDSEEVGIIKGLLEKMNVNMADMYHFKSKLPIERVRGMMKKDTWLSAQEALGMGFVDELVESVTFEASGKFDYLPNLPNGLKAVAGSKNDIHKNLNHKMDDQLKLVAGFFGLSPNATILEIQNAVGNLNAKVNSLSAENTSLKAKVKVFEDGQKASRIVQAKTLLDEAVKGQRIRLEQRPFFEASFVSDFETGKNLLASMKGKVPRLSKVPEVVANGKMGVQPFTYQGKTFKELDKENPAALAELKEQDFPTFKQLFKASYGVEFTEK